MLIDDKKRTVELYVENLLWGNIILTSKNSEWTFNNERLNKFKENIEKWILIRNDNEKKEEFLTLTEAIYNRILHYRIHGLLEGQLQDRDKDKELEMLRADNLKLAKELDLTYKPPPLRNASGLG